MTVVKKDNICFFRLSLLLESLNEFAAFLINSHVNSLINSGSFRFTELILVIHL